MKNGTEVIYTNPTTGSEMPGTVVGSPIPFFDGELEYPVILTMKNRSRLSAYLPERHLTAV